MTQANPTIAEQVELIASNVREGYGLRIHVNPETDLRNIGLPTEDGATDYYLDLFASIAEQAGKLGGIPVEVESLYGNQGPSEASNFGIIESLHELIANGIDYEEIHPDKQCCSGEEWSYSPRVVAKVVAMIASYKATL